MWSLSDSWLGFGVVVVIGMFVVGFSTVTAKLIIWLFGPEHPAEARSPASAKSQIHEAA